MSDLVLGTAGHVDHGKTALVAALTGVDTDRLPEEKARGISIALGFARLEMTGGRSVALVDVPGHERFVRHMVAGASGIDGYLMCVAADDGVMPQTLEHLAVLELLDVRDGVVAVTKADLADPGPALAAVRALVGDGVEILPVSAMSGAGLGDLRVALERLAARLVRRTAGGRTRLFVDRAFTVAGAGTVVTGTLWGAPIETGARVVVHPAGVPSRVRGVEVHDEGVVAAGGGRVALNLAGVARDRAGRGSVIVRSADEWSPTERLDVTLHWLSDAGGPLATRRRLQVFHGTSEVAATCILLEGDSIEPGEHGFVQLRLEVPVLAAVGDRLVLRSAERRTVGGAVVVDAAPSRHGRGSPAAGLLARAASGEPVDPPPPPAPEPPPATPAPAADPLDRELAAILVDAGLRPPGPAELAERTGRARREVEAALGRLVVAGDAVRGGDLWFDAAHAAAARGTAVAALSRGPLGVGALRDLWGVGRKQALALAAHLDASGATRRVGDERVLRPSARSGD